MIGMKLDPAAFMRPKSDLILRGIGEGPFGF
jgi:hypothetical protein